MGIAKRKLEKRLDKLSIATEIALQAGVLIKCDIHDAAYRGLKDPVNAYKLGNFKYTNEDPMISIFDSRNDLTKYLQEILEEPLLDQCPYCAKIFEKK